MNKFVGRVLSVLGLGAKGKYRTDVMILGMFTSTFEYNSEQEYVSMFLWISIVQWLEWILGCTIAYGDPNALLWRWAEQMHNGWFHMLCFVVWCIVLMSMLYLMCVITVKQVRLYIQYKKILKETVAVTEN